MNLTAQETAMPLLKRREVSGTISFSGAAPARAALVKEIASRYHAAEDAIVVKGIHVRFGSSQASFTAYLYDSAESRQAIEPKPRDKKAKAPEKKE
ncbi:MAG TPA: hypothetical protein VJC16_07280 [Candidatus Nanoarchaeia archaeon]|nr:hypothetical protein [Candidatus Nanoarchaeia archaeon]